MITSSSELVAISVEDRVLRIRMNRPDKKNALSREMYTAMAEAVEASNSDSEVRCILFEGTNGCFSSGNDIQDFMSAPATDGESPVGRFLAAVPVAEKPILVAAVGPAIGIGTTLLLHCDLAYAGEGTRFQMPFVNLGLVPEFGSSLILPRLMGHARAAELLYFGQPFTAATAKEFGIVNEVVADDAVSDYAMEKARTLAAQPPSALRLTKKLLRKTGQDELAARVKEEGDHYTTLLTSPESAEAFTAFMEKRKPDFSKFE